MKGLRTFGVKNAFSIYCILHARISHNIRGIHRNYMTIVNYKIIGKKKIYRQSLSAAYIASSGSCLDALAPASGEGGVKKSDERRIRGIAPRMYTITTYS